MAKIIIIPFTKTYFHRDCRVVLIRDEKEDRSAEPFSSPRKNHFEEISTDEEGRRKRQKLDCPEDCPNTFKQYDSLLKRFPVDNRGGKTLRRREILAAGDRYRL